MNAFRTVIKPQKSDVSIQHQHQILLLGSCFTENIGRLLINHQFKATVNPLGILYNPLSVNKFINHTLDNKLYHQSDLNYHDHYYYHFNFHSSIANTNALNLVSFINQSITKTHKQLKSTKVLFITWGTAWYYLRENEIVGNCHKKPAKEFQKKLATIPEIKKSFLEVYQKLKKVNPSIKIVFTVSPVRHIKDGVIENQRSKAILIEAIHQLKNELEGVAYFPSYEILMDDLRDYRFYKNDMLHPNEQAIGYIWEFFKKTFFETNTINLVEEINQLKKQVSHQSLKPLSEQNKLFQNKLQEKITRFNKTYPHIKPLGF